MHFLVLFLLSISLNTVESLNCSQAPTDSLRIVCEQLQNWDRSTREKLSHPSTIPSQRHMVFPPGFDGQVPLIADAAPIPKQPESCTSLSCLCPYLEGSIAADGSCILLNGQRLERAFRKEIRRMSQVERTRFNNAMNQLKRTGQFNRLARIHSQTGVSGGAHSGPAFLPWHREYVKRVEIALRSVDPTVSVPYWDSVLDETLPERSDSILWTKFLLGSSDSVGRVLDGPFANWTTLEGKSSITRYLGRRTRSASLFTESEFDYVLSQNKVEDVMTYTAPTRNCAIRPDWNALEYTHGNPHVWVDGDMLDQSTSANDPVFFMHHSFVDFIWEYWRQRNQNRQQRSNDYPADIPECSNRQHFRQASMSPFEGVTNEDGLSNLYTDFLYVYQSRPKCPNCGSEYLFCDRSHGRQKCVSKVRIGGRCDGFETEDICHSGRCISGRCVAITVTQRPTTQQPTTQRPTTQQPTTQRPTTQRPTTQRPTTRRSTTPRPFVNCFNAHQCCNHWMSIGECRRNSRYMNNWCPASCGRCQPSFDLNIECSDHHTSCSYWLNHGECQKSALWMSENCRKSCNLCGQAKRQSCSTGGSTQTTTTTRVTTMTLMPTTTIRPLNCDEPGCWNENMCCEDWRRQGKCRTDYEWMRCNCKVSCGFCTPNYNFLTCEDYHRSCPKWEHLGECNRNPWMLENCRTSCKTCTLYSKRILRSFCRTTSRRRIDQILM